jgi:hypothetical protein
MIQNFIVLKQVAHITSLDFQELIQRHDIFIDIILN